MFSRLRLRLTLLYLAAALLLIGLVSGGKVLFITSYFQTTSDGALTHSLVHELSQRGLPVPPDLAAADRTWQANRQPLFPSSDPEIEADYDGDLASVFVLAVAADGYLLPATGSPPSPIAPNAPAIDAALEQGSDWRTVRLHGGARLRLLTYRLPAGAGPAVLQIGRVLADQDRVLEQMLLALLGLGTFSAGLVAAGSWWLAGRSLRPAQEAWARQQTFVANASHELRTPLTLIRASAEVAGHGLPSDDERRALLDDIVQECDHLRHLVDDLLLLSRLDAGRLTLEQTRVTVPDLLATVQRQVGRLADERGVRLVVTGADGAVWGDPTRLRQVLMILLDNALRYTPVGGTITLAAHREGRQMYLSVADTGCGIPAEHLPRLFDRFYRVEEARGTEAGGAGLGLAIAKALAEAQHGRIAIESQVGVGTRVSVILPLAEAATDGDTGQPAQPVDRLHTATRTGE